MDPQLLLGTIKTVVQVVVGVPNPAQGDLGVSTRIIIYRELVSHSTLQGNELRQG